MANRKSLAPYVADVPPFADIENGVTKKQRSFNDLVRPFILEELRENKDSVKMATCINGADAVYGGQGYDKAFFAQRIANRFFKSTGQEVKPDQFPTIERVTQNLLRGSGNSRSQRREAARQRRDADQS